MNQTMKKSKITLRAALVAATVFAGSVSGFALAAGGGGGGGGSLPSTSGPQIDPAQSYRDGLAALKAQDYRTAEKRFGEVLSVSRKNVEANYYMGLAKVGRGKEKVSVRYFKRAIKERPDFIEAREQLALAFVTLEKPEDAGEQLAYLQTMRSDCDSNSCEAVFTERLDKAIANVSAAVDGVQVSILGEGAFLFTANTHDARAAGEARYGESVKLINQERYGEAVGSLYQAAAMFGPHSDILNYLGYTHRKLGAFDEAQNYYAQALTLNPDHLGATEYLGELYLELGQIKNAQAQLAKLDSLCDFGCAEREDLARLIAVKMSVRSASR